MCNLINIHTYILIHPWEDQCEWHRMTRMTGPDCAVMCNLINIHTYILIHPWEDQCEWHRMTRMTGPDCAVMCNLTIIIHTYIRTPAYIVQTYIHTDTSIHHPSGRNHPLTIRAHKTVLQYPHYIVNININISIDRELRGQVIHNYSCTSGSIGIQIHV